ncbi:MAG: hypothetical protein R8G66_25875 [Cytophagales bacterium]|nr:hypothetical protein [Cytophagales bacterium]
MKHSYLEYSKLILSKVAFDPGLFLKEYHNSLKYLNDAEQLMLKTWVMSMGIRFDSVRIPSIDPGLEGRPGVTF